MIKLNSDKVSHITNTATEEVGHTATVCQADVAEAFFVQDVTFKYKIVHII